MFNNIFDCYQLPQSIISRVDHQQNNNQTYNKMKMELGDVGDDEDDVFHAIPHKSFVLSAKKKVKRRSILFYSLFCVGKEFHELFQNST